MIMKAETDGSVTFTYDGSSGVLANYISGYGISSESTVNTLESTIKEMTKKPEVRTEQRSSLEISNRVIAKFYKDGFSADSKYLIPAIKSIEVFNENTIKMTFVNGDVQKVTAQKGDAFSFEDGIVRCIAKEMIGKEGSSILNKLVSYATKVYNDAEADKKKKAEEEKKRKIASEKNYKKAKMYWEKKRAMEREKRIQEMAEAIVRAKEMEKK